MSTAAPKRAAAGGRPATGRPRAGKRLPARERILAAAVRRIASDGIDEVRIARIAIDAGVSPPLVHYHFDSRETLLAEALRYSYTRAGDARISGGEMPAAGHAERMSQMIGQCLPTTPALAEDWVLWVELWLRAARHPEMQPVAEELYARLRDWFADAIRAGIEAGEFSSDTDVLVAVDRTLALLDGFGIRVLIGDQSVPLERARAAIEASLARDLGLSDLSGQAAR